MLSRLLRRWPSWCTGAAAAWTIPYVVLAVSWTLGSSAGYPWRRPDGEYFGGAGAVAVQGWVILLVGLAGLAATRFSSRPGLLTGAGLGAAFLLATVQTFGLAIGAVGIVAAGELHNPFGLVVQLYGLAGAILYGAAVTAWHRRRHGRCPRCAGPHAERIGVPVCRPPASSAPRRVRGTAHLVLLGIVPWSAVKLWVGWGGDALGMTGEEWDSSAKSAESALSAFFASLGVDITVLAALAGVVLVLSLTQSWSQSLPRWLPWASGRRLPRGLLLVPAWIGAVSLALYGYPLIVAAGLMLAGVAPAPADPGHFTSGGLVWALLFGGTTFAGLGTALALGAWSYQQRTRPTCALTG